MLQLTSTHPDVYSAFLALFERRETLPYPCGGSVNGVLDVNLKIWIRMQGGSYVSEFHLCD